MANKVAQEAFNHLIGDLKATHGDNLASVVLYGSAASGDFVQTESDYNLLIALHRIAPEDLRLAQPPMREWQRLGHPLPVYFTFAELRDAARTMSRLSTGGSSPCSKRTGANSVAKLERLSLVKSRIRSDETDAGM